MKIENCKIVYRCPKTWESLIETTKSDIRYCSICDKGVHLCRTREELKYANQQNWCVAVAFENVAVEYPKNTEQINPLGQLLGDIRDSDFDFDFDDWAPKKGEA